MQHVTDEAVVNTSAAKWDRFINFGDRGEIEMGPSSFLDQVADQVVQMQSLHHNDDCIRGFIVEPRQQRIAIPLQDILPRAVRLRVLRFHWIVDDDEVAAAAGESATH
jgi:hypothetical protein